MGITTGRKWKIMGVLLAGAVCACGVLFYIIFNDYAEGPLDRGGRLMSTTVTIPRGASFSFVKAELKRLKLVTRDTFFHMVALVEGAPTRIRAGEYELNNHMSPRELLRKLMKGAIKEYRIVIPEGFTVRQIASRLAAQQLVDGDVFLHLAGDREFLASLSIPGKSAEGYLFPDTYLFTRSIGEKEMLEVMVRRFRQAITPEMTARADQLHFRFEDIVTLASIVQKEGGKKEEMPSIAAVFYNRLKRGMRLQSDPTVIYGIDDFDGNLTRSHLREKTPYNTYRIRGLPPGPICNPGLDAIMAVLYPSTERFLYFVSKNDGSHHFSTNLASHNRAVIKYQIKRQRQ